MLNHRRGEIRLLWRAICFIIVASLPPIVAYTALDPQKALRYNDNYYANNAEFCRGVVTVRKFDHNYPLYHYDSYIIGSSIGLFYNVSDWIQYLPDGSRPFHFDSSAQPISLTRKSLEYIDRYSDSINNVLIVLSPDILSQENRNNRITSQIPSKVIGYGNIWNYHWDFFSSAINYSFLDGYVNYEILGNKLTRQTRYPALHEPLVYDDASNELRMPKRDQLLKTQKVPLKVTKKYEPGKHNLSDAQIRDLHTIAGIFKRRGTSYKVVFGPNYDYELLSQRDDSIFKSIFGSNYVNLIYEFRDKVVPQNFYDENHYSTTVASDIMRRVYLK